MKQTITLFMWGYQPHFRFEVEFQARQVLQTVAPTMEPQALLVGVRTPDQQDGHPVCLEPEDGQWDPSLFFGCFARADEIYRKHPDHSLVYGDEPSMRDKPGNIRKRSALQAVREVMSAYDTEHGTSSYCGGPGIVGGYYVIPILQINKAQIEAYPRLPAAITFQDWKSPVSFLEAIIGCLLADSTAALERKEPGRFMSENRTDVPAVLRRAADHFCSAIGLATKDFLFHGIFDALNIISSIPYEGAETIGEILFSPPDSEAIENQVRFEEPVPLSRHRLARKVIEMTGQNLSCVCHGSTGISGLGRLTAPNGENLFRVVFTGHYKWDLHYQGVLQMKAAFGVPRLPVPRLDWEKFYSTAHRVFPNFTTAEGRRLWSFIETCMEEHHGTMLVFAEDAEREAHRLRKQSIGIEPMEITPGLVRRLSGIDGAILMSPNGVCHAIGVILDGVATDDGDSSRGARYNSAIRYLAASDSPTMCLVVSDDGYVDMLPQLPQQVLKSDVDLHLEALKTKSIDDFHQTMKWIEKHRFYLTATQCTIVNDEIARIYSAPIGLGGFRFEIQPFSPHPAMNESYYLSEP